MTLKLYNTNIKTVKKIYANTMTDLYNELLNRDLIGIDKDVYLIACADANNVDFDTTLAEALELVENSAELLDLETAFASLIPDFREPTDAQLWYAIRNDIDRIYNIELIQD